MSTNHVHQNWNKKIPVPQSAVAVENASCKKRKSLHMKSDHDQVDTILKHLKCGSDSFLSMSELMDSVVLELDSKLVSQGEHIHPEATEV